MLTLLIALTILLQLVPLLIALTILLELVLLLIALAISAELVLLVTALLALLLEPLLALLLTKAAVGRLTILLDLRAQPVDLLRQLVGELFEAIDLRHQLLVVDRLLLLPLLATGHLALLVHMVRPALLASAHPALLLPAALILADEGVLTGFKPGFERLLVAVAGDLQPHGVAGILLLDHPDQFVGRTHALAGEADDLIPFFNTSLLGGAALMDARHANALFVAALAERNAQARLLGLPARLLPALLLEAILLAILLLAVLLLTPILLTVLFELLLTPILLAVLLLAILLLAPFVVKTLRPITFDPIVVLRQGDAADHQHGNGRHREKKALQHGNIL